MHSTHAEEEKRLADFAELDAAAAASAGALPKAAGPVSSLCSGRMVGGGLPPAEVESYDGWLSHQIAAAHRAEKVSAELGAYEDAIRMRQTSQTLATAQYHFRRRVGDANERQPTPNGRDEPRPLG